MVGEFLDDRINGDGEVGFHAARREKIHVGREPVKKAVGLDRVAAGQGEAVLSRRAQRDPGESLVKGIHVGLTDPALRGQTESRESLFPDPANPGRQKQLPPGLAQNRAVEVRPEVLRAGRLAYHPLVHHIPLSGIIQVELDPFCPVEAKGQLDQANVNDCYVSRMLDYTRYKLLFRDVRGIVR
jgi:hypothetical protein